MRSLKTDGCGRKGFKDTYRCLNEYWQLIYATSNRNVQRTSEPVKGGLLYAQHENNFFLKKKKKALKIPKINIEAIFSSLF